MSALRIETVDSDIGNPVPAEDQAAAVVYYCQNLRTGCMFMYVLQFFKIS